MKKEYFDGDLLTAKTDIIAHQVNCIGAFNSGVAACIRNKFISVFFEYKVLCYSKSPNDLLGIIQVCKVNDTQEIANLFGQRSFGYENKRYTSYDGIYDALIKLKEYMVSNNKTSVAFPFKMSSDRGGADWNVIEAMIDSAFKDSDISIEIWKYEPKN